MAPKIDTKRSVVVVPSRIAPSSKDDGDVEETEIAAQITIPGDGGWSWVVLITAFFSLFIVDGVAFTIGCLLPDMTKDLGTDPSTTALVNSIEVGIYFIASPLASALINRFGFRTTGMLGSIICCLGLFASRFSGGIVSVIMFYSVINGFGCSLISMASTLIVGFYFEKLRSLAMAIVTCGSSLGITVLYPVNTKIVRHTGWRSAVLLHSGLIGLIYFLSLTFRPVVSLTITKTEDTGEPTRTVTFLPNMATAGAKGAASRTGHDKIKPSERLFSAVSSAYFPTAAAVVNENTIAVTAQAGPSTADPKMPSAGVSKLVISAQGTVSRRQIKQMQSIVSRSNFQKDMKGTVEVTCNIEAERERTTCCGRFCHWESNVPEARPIYRDDIFYDGQIERLPQYQKSVMGVPEQNRTGLEYQMAVTRAVTVNDLNEKRGVFTTAVRRVLATMLDPTLLKRCSFLLFCISGLLTYVGLLVPYVFLQDRNETAGVDPTHCTYFVSVLAVSNAIGRLTMSALTMKIHPLIIYSTGLIVAGISTIFSTVSYSLLYQYGYVIIFGFFVSTISCTRSIVIVSTYGLENLTSASGVVIMFLGFGNLFSTPLAGALKTKFGYEVSFYVSGTFITLGGVVSIPIKLLANKENRKILPEKKDETVNRRPSISFKSPPGKKEESENRRSSLSSKSSPGKQEDSDKRGSSLSSKSPSDRKDESNNRRSSLSSKSQ